MIAWNDPEDLSQVLLDIPGLHATNEEGGTWQVLAGASTQILDAAATYNVTVVPEPSTLALAAFGFAALAAWGWRRRG